MDPSPPHNCTVSVEGGGGGGGWSAEVNILLLSTVTTIIEIKKTDPSPPHK